ncbi:UDP-N-acetylmuramate dehydrogenase [Dinghuibacter silviterrae]|uniref:UDP-N-acetylenolpyruvoylglucosamine reductase n=1 Tax=Dinghuibacter silviterrae TaxID=1539049 RepID=A0A4R8DF87_9BACT|nr:UDP-N-acetylmuramate dehydrogenase [Dinghuibacter silviterrae]TDW96087.1 UDP-N-acetylmuramate dehydrogenase [Dinghuibacter silviterrae]
MHIAQHTSLKPYNTFGMDVQARYFAPFSDGAELAALLARVPHSPRMILGGGSNVLFTRDFDGLLLKNEVMGIETVAEDEDYAYVRAGAGENWHRFVQHCIAHDLGGLENLSLIPGCVGASPMQNIGAYGVEIKEVFQDLEAFHLSDGTVERFTVNDCAFGYRESVFKNKYKGQFAILHVTFRLRKNPIYNTTYGAIEQELARMGVTELSLRAVSEAVIRIRSSRLPDPLKIGNAGSFFKNPVVSASDYARLHLEYPALPAYPAAQEAYAGSSPSVESGAMKLAAGWLIEQCGWKGFRRGDAGVHERQALVLVNYGRATGEEMYALSQEILESVEKRFGVGLEREVNIIP